MIIQATVATLHVLKLDLKFVLLSVCNSREDAGSSTVPERDNGQRKRQNKEEDRTEQVGRIGAAARRK